MLAIQAWKEDRYEPPGLRRRIPPGQEDEFYDLLQRFRGLGLMLSVVSPIWRQSLEKHSSRYGWLLTLELSEINMSALSCYLVSYTREQITESEHARQVEEERAQLLPFADLAEMLANDNEEWAEADLEDGYVSDRAVARLIREKKALLRKLFEEGTISGRRKGKAVELNTGSFHDWLSEPVPVFPDWGLDYEVVPDDQEEKAHRENEERNYARTVIQRALGSGSARRMGEEPSAGDLYAAVEKQLIAGLISDSREILAVEKLISELRYRLGGEEDPIDPEVRKTLDYCSSELADLLGRLGVDAHEAIEDCAEDLDAMRGFIAKTS